METGSWIALGVGGYAAIVATAALIWNILRERRKVKIKVMYAMGVGSLEGSEMISIEVINKGPHDIRVEEYGFMLADKKTRLVNLSTSHSGYVKSRDSVSFYIPLQEVKDMVAEAQKKGLQVTYGYARDSTGNCYKGKNKKLFSSLI